jgi:hypothetical protein
MDNAQKHNICIGDNRFLWVDYVMTVMSLRGISWMTDAFRFEELKANNIIT